MVSSLSALSSNKLQRMDIREGRAELSTPLVYLRWRGTDRCGASSIGRHYRLESGALSLYSSARLQRYNSDLHMFDVCGGHKFDPH